MKLLDIDTLSEIREELRQQDKVVSFTNGCFDLLHPGHVAVLEFAKAQGDILIVAVNSDQSVRELKGPGRPIIPQEGRVYMLEALSCVDWIVLFHSTSVLPVIERLRPDVLVKGGKESFGGVVGSDFVQSYGGKVLLAPTVDGYSTTQIVDRILSLRQKV